MTIEDYKEMNLLLAKICDTLIDRQNRAIEKLKEEQEQLEEWHYDGYDPCLEHIIKILEGE